MRSSGPARRLLTLFAGASALGAVGSLGACALVLGIDPPEPEPADASIADGTSPGAETGTTVESGTSDGQGLDAGEDVRDQPDCSFPDATIPTGMFVASSFGVDDELCGSAETPCKTIQKAIDRAPGYGASLIHVAFGDYDETITMAPGLTLEGGWLVRSVSATQKVWGETCVEPAHDAVRLHGVTTAAVYAVDFPASSQPAIVRRLTVENASTPDGGASVYGVFARGANTQLVLDDVVVSTGSAGSGPPGPTGDAGAQGLTGCDAGDAATPLPGVQGPGAGPGVFTAGGWLAAAGTSGSAGKTGENGTLTAPTCATGCKSCTGVAVCASSNLPNSCGLGGAAGCGGGGSLGGVGGQGGGASVGIYVWDAHVAVFKSNVASGPGGSGGAGGAPGAPGNGGPGAIGDAGYTCATACVPVTCGEDQSSKVHGNGGVGGTGGTGSAGGNGGAGSGGPSFAIVRSDGGFVVLDASTLGHAAGGANPGDAAVGAAGEMFP